MLGRARVNAVWGDAPSADEIRKLDHERLLQNPILLEPGTQDDLAMADALLQQRSPRDVAAAFVKLYRAQLPAPEDLEDDVAPRELKPREPREPRQRDNVPPREKQQTHKPRDDARHDHSPREQSAAASRGQGGMTDGVWFRLNVGRERNADPKWLLPEICRQGEVTKKDVGAIRVFDTETLFQVDPKVVERFSQLVSERKKGGVRIMPARDQSGESFPKAAVQSGDKPSHPEGPYKSERPDFKKRKFGQKKSGKRPFKDHKPSRT